MGFLWEAAYIRRLQTGIRRENREERERTNISAELTSNRVHEDRRQTRLKIMYVDCYIKWFTITVPKLCIPVRLESKVKYE